MTVVLLLFAGLVLLVLGGDFLVRGAGGLGRAAGISPLVIGLTVVAGATSAPELAVSLDAALTGSPGLAVGNAIGSSIANVLLVLGVAAIVRSQHAGRGLLRFDVPVALVAAVLVLLLSIDGLLARTDGAVLLIGLCAYVLLAVRRGQREGRAGPADRAGPDDRAPGPDRSPGAERSHVVRNVAFLTVGVALLVAGARWLVEGASGIAAAAGLSDLVIGLTVVAIGTSLPEIVTSIIAAIRGDRELAVGNIVGSNIFNVGAVLGLTSVVIPVPIEPAAVHFDLPVLLAITVALAVMLFTGSTVSRGEGLLLVAWFTAYTAYLVLDSKGHDALPAYSAVLLFFCLPITVLALLGMGVREANARRAVSQ